MDHSESKNLKQNNPRDMQQAGTGFMEMPLDVLERLAKRGYTENFVPRYDHLEVHTGGYHLSPDDFEVDEIIRFENTSDPDDQSILYAITVKSRGIKGTFLESYGLYHEEMSGAMIRRFMRLRANGAGHSDAAPYSQIPETQSGVSAPGPKAQRKSA